MPAEIVLPGKPLSPFGVLAVCNVTVVLHQIVRGLDVLAVLVAPKVFAEFKGMSAAGLRAWERSVVFLEMFAIQSASASMQLSYYIVRSLQKARQLECHRAVVTTVAALFRGTCIGVVDRVVPRETHWRWRSSTRRLWCVMTRRRNRPDLCAHCAPLSSRRIVWRGIPLVLRERPRVPGLNPGRTYELKRFRV